MKANVPQGKPIPVHEKLQEQNAQFDGKNNNFQREFFAEMDLRRPNWDTPSFVEPVSDVSKNIMGNGGLFQVPNGDPKGNSKQITSSDVNDNLAGPNEVVQLSDSQAKQQRLMILELQEQLHSLTAIHQQNRLKSLEEQGKRQKTAQAVQETVVKIEEVRGTRMLLENSDTEIPTFNLTPQYVPNQFNFRRSASMQQCNEKRIVTRSIGKITLGAARTPPSKTLSLRSGQTNRGDTFEDPLRSPSMRSNLRVKRSNTAAAEKDSIVRRKSKTYPCPECDKQFIRNFHLIRHLRIHTGEKPFKCGECDASFIQLSDLTRHRKIHSGEKPFKCQVCKEAFNQRGNLSQHSLVHTNEKPFVCDICKQSFRLKKTLSHHMLIHSGEKPHQCNVCGKAFRQKTNLSQHRKIHAAK